MHNLDLHSKQRRYPRSGAAVIVMMIVLGGLAISLLTLAGKTSIQLKSFRYASLDIQQCNELIAYGETILMARRLEKSNFTGEIIRFDLPTSVLFADRSSSQIGIIELAKIEQSDAEIDQRWTITAYFGTSEGQLRQASKTVTFETDTK